MIALRGLVVVLWGSANWLCRRLGRWRGTKLGVRTISVGNLQAGGAGKTPLVIEIAREAVARGKVVCVLSRGYGTKAAPAGGEKISRPGEAVSPAEVGDEPALIRQQVPQAWLAVGKDRHRAFVRARTLARALGKPIDFVILDDGFQHWRIRADFQVLAVTSADWRTHWFRDFISESSRADVVVWTKGETPPPTGSEVCVRWRPQVSGNGPFHLVTGVADPADVARSLERAGIQVAKHTRFRDHYIYRREECRALLSGPRVLLTEKDAVKWRALGIEDGQYSVIARQAVWESGRDVWEHKLWKS